MKSSTFLFLLLSIYVVVYSSKISYDGYKLVKIVPKNEKQLNRLNSLREKIDFLVAPTKIDREAVALLSRKEYVKLGTKFQTQVIYRNVGDELRKMHERLRSKKAFDLNDYNTFEDILSGLDQFVANCPSGASCQLEDIGSSYEGRPLRLFKLTKPGANRRIYWFDSAIHAREWLAPATNLKLLDVLIKQQDTDAVSLLNKYDFYFLVIMNPDGYVYSWTSNRFWRKNRTPQQGGCYGADLNRNYDVCWRCDGTSTNPCSDTYGGSSAASEPETQAVVNYATPLSGRIIAWTTIHTAAQMILHPYGYTTINGICARADDHDDMYRVAEAFADAIQDTYFTVWERGTSCETIYPASGGTDDWVKQSAGVKYSFTPELRGPGFDPGPSQIQPSYEEVWNGVKAMIAEIEQIEKEKAVKAI